MTDESNEPIQFSYSGERLPPGHLGPFVLTTDWRSIAAERDAAVKESNRRDQKWMDGIRAECGTDICFDPLEPFRKPSPPTLGEFVNGLRAELSAARADVERLAAEFERLAEFEAKAGVTSCDAYHDGGRDAFALCAKKLRAALAPKGDADDRR